MNRINQNSFTKAVALSCVALLLSVGSAFSSPESPTEPSLIADNVSQKTIRFVQIPSGTYRMGGGAEEIVADALPRHEVTLSQAFEMSVEPVSYEAYRVFCEKTRRGAPDAENDRGYIVGISWYDAEAFCDWLNTAEGANYLKATGAGEGNFTYRLPTEAEWEYCARNAKPFGVDRMCDLTLREWCWDWYAPYTDRAVTDPQGPPEGMFKVVRGGYIDNPSRYNEYQLDLWRRASLPPNYRHATADQFNDFGRHNVGFRLVRSKQPLTNVISKELAAEIAADKPLVTLFVKQENNQGNATIKDSAPYFRKRYIFTAPPDNATHEEIVSMGLDPVLRNHHHSPGFTICPNGDLLVTYYSSYHEYDAEVGLVSMRLRYGTEEWDMADIFINPVGVNDHAPLIMTTDDGVIHHFWGWEQLAPHAYPFQYISSYDNGATWTEVNFPVFNSVADRFDRQPINSAFWAKDGYFYMASDGNCYQQSCSVLWRTKDMETWENPKGRTGGRHTTAVELKDGSILGLGGKNSQINGYMPQSISKDHGDTWEVTQSVFPAYAGGQRPALARLQSGLLVMSGDWIGSRGARPYPDEDKRHGIYVAYSADEGATWTFKTIPGSQRNKSADRSYHTVGYSAIQQAEDGMIHLITSRTHPCIHFCFNEAWLLDLDANAEPATEYGWRPAVGDNTTLMSNTAKRIAKVETYRENYPSTSQVRYEYSGGTADDGRFLLHGPERWYYPSGKLMMECNYNLGNRSGRYAYYTEAGSRIWEWDYKPDGLVVYRTFYPDEPDGKLKSVAAFRDNIAEGCAQTYSRAGVLLKEVWYEDGKLARTTNLRTETPADISKIY